MLRRAVQIEAFDQEGRSIFWQIYPKSEWYEKAHDIVDSDTERARLRITRIKGEQFDRDGIVEVRWDLSYSDDGVLKEERVWRQDGATEHNVFPN